MEIINCGVGKSTGSIPNETAPSLRLPREMEILFSCKHKEINKLQRLNNGKILLNSRFGNSIKYLLTPHYLKRFSV